MAPTRGAAVTVPTVGSAAITALGSQPSAACLAPRLPPQGDDRAPVLVRCAFYPI